jgi:hypothetical protein
MLRMRKKPSVLQAVRHNANQEKRHLSFGTWKTINLYTQDSYGNQ